MCVCYNVSPKAVNFWGFCQRYSCQLGLAWLLKLGETKVVYSYSASARQNVTKDILSLLDLTRNVEGNELFLCHNKCKWSIQNYSLHNWELYSKARVSTEILLRFMSLWISEHFRSVPIFWDNVSCTVNEGWHGSAGKKFQQPGQQLDTPVAEVGCYHKRKNVFWACLAQQLKTDKIVEGKPPREEWWEDLIETLKQTGRHLMQVDKLLGLQTPNYKRN